MKPGHEARVQIMDALVERAQELVHLYVLFQEVPVLEDQWSGDRLVADDLLQAFARFYLASRRAAEQIVKELGAVGVLDHGDF